jgi:hypothetical protein
MCVLTAFFSIAAFHRFKLSSYPGELASRTGEPLSRLDSCAASAWKVMLASATGYWRSDEYSDCGKEQEVERLKYWRKRKEKRLLSVPSCMCIWSAVPRILPGPALS